jgi:hypothetical protein
VFAFTPVTEIVQIPITLRELKPSLIVLVMELLYDPHAEYHEWFFSTGVHKVVIYSVVMQITNWFVSGLKHVKFPF